MSRSNLIYSATYSNVPVYEFNVDGNHVMRRRSDDWINATHILKVADYDKPARTRILEREVQKGVHEKVQGGYGKYQGTWIPLDSGRELAAKNGVLEKLRPMFDFVPGDRSPPPAPKHATATSSKPRQPRAPAQPKRQPVTAQPDYDQMDVSVHDGETPDNVTIASESFDDYDNSHFTGSRKRRRLEETMSQADREHQLWADELLDYFMLQDNPMDSLPQAPLPPASADLDRSIDDKGHTALHWASAMGDIEVVKDLLRRGANIDVQARNGETPLMRAAIFTNNYDRQNMDRLAGLLMRTVNMQNWYGETVFHHIAQSTQRKSKYGCARYYMDSILNRMADILSPDGIVRILDTPDQNGDTAITIAARNGARKCVRSLISRGASTEIPNQFGETADQLIVQLNQRRQERQSNRHMSSSPYQFDTSQSTIAVGASQSHMNGLDGNIPIDPLLVSQQSLAGGGGSQNIDPSDSYRSDDALALISSVMPTIFNKARTLALSIDTEVAEKEAELAEAERVAAARRQEIELLKRQAEELRAEEEHVGSGAVDGDDALLTELEELMQECEGLTAEEQDTALKELILQEEAEADENMQNEDLLIGTEDDSLEHRMELVQELHGLVQQRKDLFKTIVQNLSNAGIDEKQHEYKRLITGALDVREEDVEGMLPEIVAELED